MTSNTGRLLAYVSGILIILLSIPLGLVAIGPPALIGVEVLIAFLVVICIWSGMQGAGRQSAHHDSFLSEVSRQAKNARKSVLYEGELGLYQKWYLEMRLAEEMARCRRYGLSMALLVVKLERTSALDLPAGGWQSDASQAAYATARSVRTVDLTAALGPREFGVCLVHCDREGAEIAQARLEKSLKAYGPTCGLVVYPLEKVEPKQILRLAQSRAADRAERQIA